ncbi:polynucleotide kinase [Gammaproteobacteria bacterium]|nr:polynucleotide kinase [Gammaproteobacteria bacterium]
MSLIKATSKKISVIVDLDGTIADIEHRLHFVQKEPKDWDGFFNACVNDKPFRDVIELVRRLALSGLHIKILSGRSETVKKETLEWIDKFCDFSYSLSMRKARDHRPDWVVKKEMVLALGLTPGKVLCVIDDRKSLVAFWRKMGYTCLQTADHNF